MENTNTDKSMSNIEQVIIIGSGPAGLTAALYAARARLDPLVITGDLKGGQLMTTTEVENFPGYMDPVQGPDIIRDMETQAKHFGTRIVSDTIRTIDTSVYPFHIQGETVDYRAQSIIVATGATALWLNAKNEDLLRGKGISTCATCDGAFFKGEEIVVIGGGDSAMEEALFLTRYASKVTIIHRRNEFKASKIMLERAQNHPKIYWKCSTRVTEWLSNAYGELRGAVIETTEPNESKCHQSELDCGGAFIAIGHKPATGFLFDTGVSLDSDGYIQPIQSDSTMTSIPGIFVAGDVSASNRRYKQAITASGEGCKAAMDVEKWLETKMNSVQGK
jgi:thioredoxin reductase (NADPH)